MQPYDPWLEWPLETLTDIINLGKALNHFYYYTAKCYCLVKYSAQLPILNWALVGSIILLHQLATQSITGHIYAKKNNVHSVMVAYEGAIHNILFSLGIKHAVAAATGNPADKVTKLLSTGKPTVYCPLSPRKINIDYWYRVFCIVIMQCPYRMHSCFSTKDVKKNFTLSHNEN